MRRKLVTGISAGIVAAGVLVGGFVANDANASTIWPSKCNAVGITKDVQFSICIVAHRVGSRSEFRGVYDGIAATFQMYAYVNGKKLATVNERASDTQHSFGWYKPKSPAEVCMVGTFGRYCSGTINLP